MFKMSEELDAILMKWSAEKKSCGVVFCILMSGIDMMFAQSSLSISEIEEYLKRYLHPEAKEVALANIQNVRESVYSSKEGD